MARKERVVRGNKAQGSLFYALVFASCASSMRTAYPSSLPSLTGWGAVTVFRNPRELSLSGN